MKRTLGALLCVCVFEAALLTGCGGLSLGSALPIESETKMTGEEPITEDIFAMDTHMTIKVFSEDGTVMEEALALIENLENRMSTTQEDSEIAVLNRTGAAVLSEDLTEVMGRALELHRETEGALDISVYPIVRSWGFTTGRYRVPEAEEIASLLAEVDASAIRLDRKTGEASIPDGMQVDLGAVGKGYTGDRLIRLFKERGVTSGLLNLGGNVQAIGSKPDGSSWKIAIQDPKDPEKLIGVLNIKDEAVITSGGYERYFEDAEGNIWWHIMDPSTGRPARNGILSATVIGREGVYCDALSTSLFIMGEERAVDFWDRKGDFEMILVTEDGWLLITEGLLERLELQKDCPYRPVTVTQTVRS